MEILILQYALLLLVCFWWVKPLASLKMGRHVRLPLFSFLCIFVLLFLGCYILVQEIKPVEQITVFYNIVFLCVNMILYLLVPGGYLYLRNEFNDAPLRKADWIHILPALLYAILFVTPYFFYGQRFVILENRPTIFLTLYGYCTIGVYILLAMKFFIAQFQYFSDSKRKKKGNASSERPANPQEPRAHEVLVGSIAFDTEQLTKMDETLRTFLLAHQPYLQRGYNLKQLSDDTNIPLHHLSAFINQYYGIHFNDLINEYRVQYCQVKIKNDEWRSKTLEAIAEESGFNNRNTFAAAFKKVTGFNPSDFLKMVKRQQIA